MKEVILLSAAIAMTAFEASALKHNHNNVRTKSDQTVLYIKNENMKDLALLIKPEKIDDWSVDETKQVIDERLGGWYSVTIPANTAVEVEVPTYELGEIDLFSVTGETNPLTPIGTCYNLHKGKAYELRFTDNPFGTDCISKRVAKASFSATKTIAVPYKQAAHLSPDPVTTGRPSNLQP